jgi:hypothetical protein
MNTNENKVAGEEEAINACDKVMEKASVKVEKTSTEDYDIEYFLTKRIGDFRVIDIITVLGNIGYYLVKTMRSDID